MSVYEEYVKKYPNMPTSDLAEKIKGDGHKQGTQLNSIRRGIRRNRSKIDIQDVREDGDRYEVVDDTYKFYIGGHLKHEWPMEAVTKAYEWYTNPNAMTVRETCHQLFENFGVEVSEPDFKRIKKTMGLVKACEPVPPHMYQELDGLNDHILEVMESKIATKKRASESKHFRKRFEELKEREISAEMFVDRVVESVEELQPPEVTPVEFDDTIEPSDLVIHLADWHAGLCIEHPHAEYSKDIFWDRIEQVKSEVRKYLHLNRQPVENVYIVGVGDFMDGPLGNMHADQSIHQDLYGDEQCVVAAQALADLTQYVDRLTDAPTHVKVRPGNHDRVSSSRKEDPHRMAAKLMFELAKAYCSSDGITWEFFYEAVGEFVIRNTKVLLIHGDQTPKNHRDIVHSHRCSDAENYLILMGHTHHLKIREDLDIMLVVGGSLPGATKYSVDKLGKGARPSQSILRIDDSGPRPLWWLPLD